MRTARDVAAGWSMVFTDKRVSKAIVLGKSGKADEEAVKRRKWMVKQLGKVLPKFWDVAEDLDTGSAIEGHLNQVGAMIKLRQEEFGVDIGNFVKLLGLKGRQRAMFLEVGVGFAKGTIAKGRALTTPESQNLMRGLPWDT
jgi:hypothetical protein